MAGTRARAEIGMWNPIIMESTCVNTASYMLKHKYTDSSRRYPIIARTDFIDCLNFEYQVTHNESNRGLGPPENGRPREECEICPIKLRASTFLQLSRAISILWNKIKQQELSPFSRFVQALALLLYRWYVQQGHNCPGFSDALHTTLLETYSHARPL